jgi:hypothetical protein
LRFTLETALIHWYGYGARYLFMPELCFGVALLFAAVSGVLKIGRLAAIMLLCTMVWKAPLPIVQHAELTFRRSRTQFGVNFVASLVGEMRLWPAG